MSNKLVLTPDDIMRKTDMPVSGTRCVVYDDDHYYMASVVAEKLVEAGLQVTYVTPLPAVSTWTDYTLEQDRIINRFNQLGIDIQVNVGLGDQGKFTSTLTGKSVAMDYEVLMLVGARLPDNSLYEQALADERLPNVYRIGDCHSPGTIQGAVLAGHTLARELSSEALEPQSFKRQGIEIE